MGFEDASGSLIVVDHRIRVPVREFIFTFARSSGAGGQNVNKVNSKAIMRWNLLYSPSIPDDVRGRFLDRYENRLTDDGELIIMSDEHRDQVRNRSTCIERLVEMLRSVARPPKKRVKTKPTKGGTRRRLKAKQEHSEKKANRRKPGFGD